MLREQVIDGTGAICSGRQLALFLHEGMGAWLRAVGPLLPGAKVVRESASPVTPPSARQLQPHQPSSATLIVGLMPPRYYAEAASLLASMTLAARKDALR
jgi:hypothetical protein